MKRIDTALAVHIFNCNGCQPLTCMIVQHWLSKKNNTSLAVNNTIKYTALAANNIINYTALTVNNIIKYTALAVNNIFKYTALAVNNVI